MTSSRSYQQEVESHTKLITLKHIFSCNCVLTQFAFSNTVLLVHSMKQNKLCNQLRLKDCNVYTAYVQNEFVQHVINVSKCITVEQKLLSMSCLSFMKPGDKYVFETFTRDRKWVSLCPVKPFQTLFQNKVMKSIQFKHPWQADILMNCLLLRFFAVIEIAAVKFTEFLVKFQYKTY